MKITLTRSLACAIGVGERDLISIVGAGGKTSIMYGLARELASSGSKVLVTTTTRIFYPASDQADFVLIGEENESTVGLIKDTLACAGVIVAARERMGDKVVGFDPQFVDRLYESLDGWHCVVESDGARGKSFKIPEKHEPPLARSTSIYAIVIGADSLGKPLDAGFVYKHELVAQRLGVNEDACLDIDLVSRSLGLDDGYLWHRPSKARTCVMLNKVWIKGDGDQDVLPFLLACRLRRDERIERVVLGCFGDRLTRSFMVVG